MCLSLKPFRQTFDWVVITRTIINLQLSFLGFSSPIFEKENIEFNFISIHWKKNSISTTTIPIVRFGMPVRMWWRCGCTNIQPTEKSSNVSKVSVIVTKLKINIKCVFSLIIALYQPEILVWLDRSAFNHQSNHH